MNSDPQFGLTLLDNLERSARDVVAMYATRSQLDDQQTDILNKTKAVLDETLPALREHLKRKLSETRGEQ